MGRTRVLSRRSTRNSPEGSWVGSISQFVFTIFWSSNSGRCQCWAWKNGRRQHPSVLQSLESQKNKTCVQYWCEKAIEAAPLSPTEFGEAHGRPLGPEGGPMGAHGGPFPL